MGVGLSLKSEELNMLRVILIIFIGLLAVVSKADTTSVEGDTFLHESSVDWETNDFPIHRWKTLVGAGIEGRTQPDDIYMGTWELAPKAIYHGHKHETPEIYYIISGKALWTVGDETREVTKGTSIYTRPGEVHKMVNLGEETVQAIWIWWAPNGDRKVFQSDYIFTEEPGVQPEGAGFSE